MRTDTLTNPQPESAPSAAATQGGLRGAALAARILSGATELFYLGWLELTLIDWLWSSVNPYPYAASLATSGAALAGFAALQWRGRREALYGAVAALIVSGAIAASTWDASALRFAAASGAGFAGICVLRGRFARSGALANVCAAGSVAILMLAAGSIADILASPIHTAISQGQWLGSGLGAPVSNPAAVGPSSLDPQWGACPLLLLLGTVCAAIAAATVRIAQTRSGSDGFGLRTAVLATAVAAIVGLAAQGRETAPFLTTTTCAGTWAIAMAVAALAICAAPNASRPAARTRSAAPQARARWLAAVAGVAAIIVLALHLALSARVRRYVGAAAPAGIADFTPLDHVSQPMQDATVAMEDGHFYQEGAFDFAAMHRALRVDIRAGRIRQGGSTLTQQLAKNLFLTQDRTIWRKIQEAFLAIELSHNLTKRRILELYVNSIDYGYGCRGIAQAASYYFHTTPAKLTLAESAILVGLVPDPPQPDKTAIAAGEAQYEDLGMLQEGEQTALGRIAFFFPGRYTPLQLAAAQNTPLERTIYPYKDAYDRDAVDTIPAVWHGVGFYFYADPSEPSQIDYVSPYLLPELASFLVDARRRYDLVGIDHLGVYNDRGMRQAHGVISAHAYGQAIDISGFRFADGRNILVADHTDPKLLPTILRMEALLRRHFDIVVGWQQDPLRHQTHFHCEVRGPRPVAPG